MKRRMPLSLCLAVLAATQPVFAAGAADVPYYGPMKAWRGIGFKFGYKEDLQKDGAWRVVASTRFGEAIDMALYRAAELAREQGYAYVELLGGSASRSPGYNSATLYMRPSRVAAPPATCPSRRPGTCYTAAVAELLRRLGGATGAQGGVPVVDHRDRYGRAVIVSGYGLGAAVPRVPLPSVAPVAAAPYRPPITAHRPDPATEYERALKAAQPARGESHQGWTVSD